MNLNVFLPFWLSFAMFVVFRIILVFTSSHWYAYLQPTNLSHNQTIWIEKTTNIFKHLFHSTLLFTHTKIHLLMTKQTKTFLLYISRPFWWTHMCFCSILKLIDTVKFIMPTWLWANIPICVRFIQIKAIYWNIQYWLLLHLFKNAFSYIKIALRIRYRHSFYRLYLFRLK